MTVDERGKSATEYNLAESEKNSQKYTSTDTNSATSDKDGHNREHTLGNALPQVIKKYFYI